VTVARSDTDDGAVGGAVRADVIIVAAGSSTRMRGVDKLRVPLAGRPLLAWTTDAIAAAPEVERIVLVGSSTAVEVWTPKIVARVAGGMRRQDSVRAGFDALEALGPLPDERLILVHDGARPLVSPELVSAVVRAAAAEGAAIPVVRVAETLKRVRDGRLIETVDRSDLVVAQTPQGALAGLLRRAWAAAATAPAREFTDEAALLEACTIPVHPIPGDPVNLKVTLPADLRRVEAVLASSTRTGLGTDSHPFGPGSPLRLGGIEFDAAPALHGHSDGDVVLHAIADALLGAAGLGDLGRVHPADERTPRGASSRDLLAVVVTRLGDAGWRPSAVDITVVGARPRLGSRLDEMRTSIAELLELEASAVSVKASSGNLDGSEGAGRVISTYAVATIVRRTKVAD
jgi:2-C-methyl-D-erythritol 4-phosphate cytidylyltransferase/2-C-methyl-D-erythritol 2,4-cyclodiphosphate synthase